MRARSYLNCLWSVTLFNMRAVRGFTLPSFFPLLTGLAFLVAMSSLSSV